MRLLDRYLLRELLVPLCYCLSGFLVFWVSFDLLAELSDFQEDQLSVGDIAQYYLLRAPELLVVVMPIALLLALLYTLSNHSRHHELTAMRAAGLSLARLSVPYLLVGFSFSIVLFVLNEFWVPQGDEAARLIVRGRRASAEEKVWYRNFHFQNARDGRIWNIAAFNLNTYEMRDPQIEWIGTAQSKRLIARTAAWTNDCWLFFEVQQIEAIGGTNHESMTTQTNRLTLCDLTETPQQIKSEIKISRLTNFRTAKDVQLSIREILRHLRLHPDINPGDRALLHTKLHERLAAPWTCVVVVLIALPFGAVSSRRNAFASVASSLGICFAFFILLRLGLALGTGGYIPPWLAAWLPNGLFAGAGLWLARRVP
jgi:lipopolysaccharide export system permease protein